METVLLKNGTEEVAPLVKMTMLLLHRLAQENPIALCELAETCRDSTHIPFGKTGDDLREQKLLRPDGKLHDSIRNIVLSAVMGDRFDMHLVNPRDLQEDTCAT